MTERVAAYGASVGDIRLVGNTCNFGYSWALAYRSFNRDAHVYIESEASARDMPSWDDRAMQGEWQPPWIHRLPSVRSPRGWIGSEPRSVLRELRDARALHAFGALAASWALRSGRPYIYQSYGDISSTPWWEPKRPIRSSARAWLARQAIRQAETVVLSQLLDLPFAEMLRLGSRITWLPIIYDSGVASQIGEIAPEILQCVRDAELVFYIPSRQEAFKRQDKALRAFKTFLETRKERVILIIARWGDLAAERQREVVSLGLEKHVVWVNCLPKAELMALLRLPNLVVLDEFEDDPYIMSFGGVARDAMAAGAAVISRVSMEYIRLLHRTLPPTLFTDEKEESILARMCEYADMTPSQRVEHGLRARAWLDEEHAPAQLVPRYLALYA